MDRHVESVRQDLHDHHHGSSHGHSQALDTWLSAAVGFVIAMGIAWGCGMLKPEVRTEASYATEQAACEQDNPGQAVRCAMVMRGFRLGDYRATKQTIMIDPFGIFPTMTDAKTGWYKAILRQKHRQLLEQGDAAEAGRLRSDLDAVWLFNDQPPADKP